MLCAIECLLYMEHLEIVCPNTNTPTGEKVLRADVINQGLWCRSTNLFVLNDKGEILCHQRSLEKERMPGVWSTHLGGHVGHGETYESNVQKEMEEEIGVGVPNDQIIPWRTTRIEPARLWVREFVTLLNVDVDQMTPQPGEVEVLRWMKPDEIIKSAKENPEQWCAGTHDFLVEYHCLRAALAVATSTGIIKTDNTLDTWHPLLLPAI